MGQCLWPYANMAAPQICASLQLNNNQQCKTVSLCDAPRHASGECALPKVVEPCGAAQTRRRETVRDATEKEESNSTRHIRAHASNMSEDILFFKVFAIIPTKSTRSSQPKHRGETIHSRVNTTRWFLFVGGEKTSRSTLLRFCFLARSQKLWDLAI